METETQLLQKSLALSIQVKDKDYLKPKQPDLQIHTTEQKRTPRCIMTRTTRLIAHSPNSSTLEAIEYPLTEERITEQQYICATKHYFSEKDCITATHNINESPEYLGSAHRTCLTFSLFLLSLSLPLLLCALAGTLMLSNKVLKKKKEPYMTLLGSGILKKKE